MWIIKDFGKQKFNNVGVANGEKGNNRIHDSHYFKTIILFQWQTLPIFYKNPKI